MSTINKECQTHFNMWKLINNNNTLIFSEINLFEVV